MRHRHVRISQSTNAVCVLRLSDSLCRWKAHTSTKRTLRRVHLRYGMLRVWFELPLQERSSNQAIAELALTHKFSNNAHSRAWRKSQSTQATALHVAYHWGILHRLCVPVRWVRRVRDEPLDPRTEALCPDFAEALWILRSECSVKALRASELGLASPVVLDKTNQRHMMVRGILHVAKSLLQPRGICQNTRWLEVR